MNFAPPRGMRDFYPEDMRTRNKIFNAWKKAAAQYGFEEYDAPVVETEELLTRKAGEEIVRQIYNFTDKSDRKLALRPEMTPSLARMIIARQKQLTYPLKWFSIPQCFRYERMTKGRKREHYQFNLDIVGVESIMAEAEVLGAAISACQFLGLDHHDFRVRIGSRALLADLFHATGLPDEHFLPVCLVLDKMEKISRDETRDMLGQEGLTAAEIDKVFSLMKISTIDQAESFLAQPTQNSADIRTLFTILEAADMREYLEFDIAIIRGLSYYTGIVFEAFDTRRKFRAIFGGGRYNNLLSSLGGERMPSVGLGFGDVVIHELLNSLEKLKGSHGLDEIQIAYMENSFQMFSLQIATLLRKAGHKVNLSLSAEKPKKVFGRANKLGVNQVIFIGSNEVAQQIFSIKNMTTGEQRQITLEQLKNGDAGIL